jgi:hypothetical protein
MIALNNQGRGNKLRCDDYRRTFACFVAVVSLAALIACSRDRASPADDRTDVADIPAQESTVAPGEIARLRALGYLDYSPDPANPLESGVTRCDRERAQPGYTLVTIRHLERADLVALDGTVVHSWRGDGLRSWSRSVLLDDGDLLVVGERKYIMRLGWDGEPRWRRDFRAHHDVTQTPGGNLIVLVDQKRRLPAIDPEAPVRDNLIRVLTQGGETVDDISLYDALMKAPDHVIELEPVEREKERKAVDLLHTNSIQWIPANFGDNDRPGQFRDCVLVSIRHQDTIALFDWFRREVVWAWGRGEIMGPHDATMLSSGNILVFDNGLGRGWSRVIELDPKTEEIVWEYRAPHGQRFYTDFQGSAQRLANGNTLIAESRTGRVFEVTPSAEVVWDYHCPYLNDKSRRATLARARRYDARLVESLLTRFDGGRR